MEWEVYLRRPHGGGEGGNRTGLKGSTGCGLAEWTAGKRHWGMVLCRGLAGAKAGSETGEGGHGLANAHQGAARLRLSWGKQEGLLRKSLSSQKAGRGV